MLSSGPETVESEHWKRRGSHSAGEKLLEAGVMYRLVRWWDPRKGQSGGAARAKTSILARLDLWAGRRWTREGEGKRDGQTRMGTESGWLRVKEALPTWSRPGAAVPRAGNQSLAGVPPQKAPHWPVLWFGLGFSNALVAGAG